MSRRIILSAALVLLAALVPYLGVIGHGFLNWDDPDYVTENHLLTSTDGLRAIWTSLENPQVYPMVFTTLWVEYHLWGIRPAGYHLVNLILHVCAALLLLRFLLRLPLPAQVPLAVALLFALHPTQVASVAWIAERKNVLSGVFYFACLGSYLSAMRSGRRSQLLLSWLWALLATLSKTTVVTLPLTLALLELWLGEPAGSRARASEKAAPVPPSKPAATRTWERPGRAALGRLLPFAGLALAMALLTVFREHGPKVASDVGLLDRLLIAGRAYWFYIGKLLAPLGLSGVYARWPAAASRLPGAVGWLGILLLALFLIRFRHRLNAAVPFGVAQFSLAGLPTSGIVPFGYMDKTFVADHFLYLPSWGFWLAFFGLAASLAGSLRWGRNLRRPSPAGGWRQPVLLLALLLGVLYTPLTVRYVRNWSDTETFWNHVLSRDPHSWLAYGNRGQFYATQGKLEPALKDLREAIRLRPGYVEANFNLGYVLDRLGRTGDAIEAYRATLRLSPLHPDAHNNLGILYLRTGDLPSAVRELSIAAELDPGNAAFAQNLRRVEAAQRRAEETGAPEENAGGTAEETGQPAEDTGARAP